MRVVLDSSARLPLESRPARTAREVPVWIAVTGRAPAPSGRDVLAALGCEILDLPGDGPVPILPLLDELGRRGVTDLPVEGGGRPPRGPSSTRGRSTPSTSTSRRS